MPEKTTVPTLETSRLRLRAHELDDFVDSAELWSDKTVTQYMTGEPSNSEVSWWRLLWYSGHWNMMGFGYWAVETKETSQFIGEVGFSLPMRATENVHLPQRPETGWVLKAGEFGKGYATEAVQAALDWADRILPATSCIINGENLASIRVAEKTGYVFQDDPDVTLHGRPALLYGRDRASAQPL